MILEWLTFIALVFYAYFTYLIAKDIYEPSVSFSFNQIPSYSHLNFNLINKSKVEVEVYGKLWTKVGDEVFQFKSGFYGNGHPWILQPFTEGHGHLELRELINEEQIKLGGYITKNDIKDAHFNFQIKYRKVGSKKWKKQTPQKFIYSFEKELWWLNV